MGDPLIDQDLESLLANLENVDKELTSAINAPIANQGANGTKTASALSKIDELLGNLNKAEQRLSTGLPSPSSPVKRSNSLSGTLPSVGIPTVASPKVAVPASASSVQSPASPIPNGPKQPGSPGPVKVGQRPSVGAGSAPNPGFVKVNSTAPNPGSPKAMHSPVGPAGAKTPPLPIRKLPGTTLINGKSYPVSHRGSIAGAPKQFVTGQIEKIEEMKTKLEIRKAAGVSRWIRKNSDGTRLTAQQVSNLLEEGASMEDFEDSPEGRGPVRASGVPSGATFDLLQQLDSLKLDTTGGSSAESSQPRPASRGPDFNALAALDALGNEEATRVANAEKQRAEMEQATMDAQLAAAQQVVNMAKLIQEEQERMAQSEAAEAARLQAEKQALAQRKIEEERQRRSEQEARATQLAEEQAKKRAAAEKQKQLAAAQARVAAADSERIRLEEEEKARATATIAEYERKRKEEELRRQQEAEAQRLRVEEALRVAKAEELRQLQEAEARRAAEQQEAARKAFETEAARRRQEADDELARMMEETKRAAQAAEAKKQQADEAQRLKVAAEEAALRKAALETKRQLDNARIAAEAEAMLAREQESVRIQQEAFAKQRAIDEEKAMIRQKQIEDEVRHKRTVEEALRARQAEEARQRAIVNAEARRKAEAEAQAKLEDEYRARVEADNKIRAEAEARRAAEEKARLIEQLRQQKLEEERQAALAEQLQREQREREAAAAAAKAPEAPPEAFDDLLDMLDFELPATPAPAIAPQSAVAALFQTPPSTPPMSRRRMSQVASGPGIEAPGVMRLSQKMMISPNKMELRKLSVSFKASAKAEPEPAPKPEPVPASQKEETPAPAVPPRPQPQYQTLNTSSALETAILKAAASNRRRLDSFVDEDTWVFPDRRSSAIAAPDPSKRASMLSMSNLPKITVRVNVPHLTRSFDCTIDPGQSIANFKLFMWVDVFELQGVMIGGQLIDYLFRAEYDDFFLDEKILVKDAPYFKYCAELKIIPTVHYVNRSELESHNRIIEQIIGSPLWINEEANFLRKEMHRVITLLMATSYRRVRVTPASLPTPEGSEIWPAAFSVYVLCPGDPTPMPDRPPEKRVTIPLHGTARRVISAILDDHPYLFVDKPETPDDYVLKVRGYEEYVMGELELFSLDFIRQCLRKRGRIDVVMLEKASLPTDVATFVNHHDAMLKRPTPFTIDLNELLPREPASASMRLSSLSLEKPLRLVIRSLEPIPFDTKLFSAPKKRNDLIQLVVTCELRHVNAQIGPLSRSSKQLYLEDSRDPVNFDSTWLELPNYSIIPRASVIHFEVRALFKDKETPVAWCQMRLYDSAGVVAPGQYQLGLWTMTQHSSPDSGCALDDPAGPRLSFVLEDLGKSVMFPEFNYAQWKAENPNVKDDSPPQTVIKTLQTIIAKDALQRLSKEEQQLLWLYRGWCKTSPLAVSKFLAAVPWHKPGVLREVYRLLHEWTPVPPMTAIELLNKNFVDPEIREFAVRSIHRLSDEELADILLQLVQALKHEINHDSALARFLIARCIYNPSQLGNYFFWYLKACTQIQDYKERFEVVLEVYLRYTSSFRDSLRNQASLFTKLTAIATELKTVKDTRRRQWLEEKLRTMEQAPTWQIPINCNMVTKGLVFDKCKSLDSKTVRSLTLCPLGTMPLWLTCQNVDPLGDPLTIMFKVGDDLRQDQLVVQMFRIMDKLWLNAGLDLKMSPYVVLDAGHETGMIEVVQHSATNAAIQKQYGGMKAAFSEKPLAEWLRKHNPKDSDYTAAIKDFVRSCAGYCVATYVLGIGDRHNDNVMCTKNGYFFHIDFGRFLGNSEKFAGVSRDRAPFVFTPEFLFAMGGAESPHYKQFVELSCKAFNVVRKNANVFINLFAMMLQTGIPELRKEDDINYLRDAFALELSEDEAAKRFEELIDQSVKTKAVQWNNFIHIAANNKPAED